jgi:uncharacterized protein (TIGR02646 family)
MAYRNPSPRLPRTVAFDALESAFLESIKPWSKEKWSESFGTAEQNATRNAIKVKIKTDLEDIQDNYCAFCGLDLELAFEVHREHIAPQYKHPHYIFEPENLVLSCNFCNMHKGKKITVRNDTTVYTTTTFKILHPHRDNLNEYLACDYQNRELIFTIVGPEHDKTQATIKCVGLDEPHLMSQRGAIIFKASLPVTQNEDELVKQIVSKNRRGNK